VTIEDKQEMEWDNSALTITVNPMDQEIMMYGERGGDQDLHDDETDSEEEEEEETSAQDNEAAEPSDNEAEPGESVEKVKTRELEWDDSTLTY